MNYPSDMSDTEFRRKIKVIMVSNYGDAYKLYLIKELIKYD